MSAFHSVSVEDIIRRGSVKDADVLKLRAAFYDNGVIAAAEAEQIFAINDACPVQDQSWADFFVEAITDHIVNGAKPEGYLTAENASWLIARIGSDGKVDSKTELDLLVNVLDKARWSPESLVHFALEQVKRAVADGEGPLRAGLVLERGTITEGEVELLRRILYSFGGDGYVAITRTEADVLFAINDACASGPQTPAWTELFVKAVANVLMATSGYAVPSREAALKSEAWLQSRGELSITSILSSLGTAGLGSIFSSYREQSAEERALARLDRQRIEIITNEEITAGEAEWLAERICRDGRITESEAALLAFLHKESPKIHPALEQRLQSLGRAA